MLRRLWGPQPCPVSYQVDLTSQFQAGNVGQLGLMGNILVAGLSDGTAPLGLIDDFRTTTFFQPVIDEIVIASAVGELVDGRMVTVAETMAVLENAYISSSSFMCNLQVALRPKNGIVVFPVGTELNYDADGDGHVDSIKAYCQYLYQVPNMPGDNSVDGSNKITIHFDRAIYSTDIYETSQRYPINAPLFCSEDGKLTTRQPSDTHPVIAQVLAPPTAANHWLDFLWL